MSNGKLFATMFSLGAIFGGALVGLCRKKKYSEADLIIANTNGFLRGTLSADKEFAEFYKKHDPEGYEKIMKS